VLKWPIVKLLGISITMPYWDERVAEMSKEFKDVKVEKYHVSFTPPNTNYYTELLPASD
jgi:hypothetical protein